MRLPIVVILCALLGTVSAPAAARAASVADTPPAATITVTGHAEISRVPDLATVTVTIETNDDRATRAVSENNRRFAALSAKLATLGIPAGDVVSGSLSSYFNPRPPTPNLAGGVFGYVVTRNVQVKVSALNITGSVVDAATAAGATQINGVAYDFRDRGAVERAALAAAVNDAYAQAQTIAGAAHVQLVRVLRISTELNAPGRIQPLMAMARAVPDSVPTTIAPSNVDVSSAVSVTYAVR